MNNRTFTQDLLGVQNDLLRFAYKLTSDREEANDLLPTLKDGYIPSCVIFSSTITVKWYVTRHL